MYLVNFIRQPKRNYWGCQYPTTTEFSLRGCANTLKYEIEQAGGAAEVIKEDKPDSIGQLMKKEISRLKLLCKEANKERAAQR